MNMAAKEQASLYYTPKNSKDSQHLRVTKDAFAVALCGPN